MDEMPPGETCSDADLLIEYLTHQGVTVRPEVLAAVEQLRDEEVAKHSTPAARTAFCGAYSELARQASPVTAESLRACSEDCAGEWKRWPWSVPRKVSEADRAVLRHHTWASVALIVLLVVQSYWLVGSTLISGIRKQDQRADAAQVAVTNASTATPGPSANPTIASEEEAKEDTHVWLLSAWSAIWKWVPDLYRRWSAPTPVTDGSVPPATTSSAVAAPNKLWELYIGTKFVLQILQTYVLPLVYGWVGAMAFVLRSLIVAVKNKTFRLELNVEYRLRVYLGLLAGLVIGWFLSPKGDARQFGVADLTPAAISFVAGYSVEILFSTMDRIVAGFVTAFGGSTLQTPQTPKETRSASDQ
jgi:hypothetical protein